MSKDAEHIIKLIAKYFEPPCQYELDGIDAFDFLDKADKDGKSWCEQHCSSTNFEGNIDCWKRLLNLLTRCENEQLEYGKE